MPSAVLSPAPRDQGVRREVKVTRLVILVPKHRRHPQSASVNQHPVSQSQGHTKTVFREYYNVLANNGKECRGLLHRCQLFVCRSGPLGVESVSVSRLQLSCALAEPKWWVWDFQLVSRKSLNGSYLCGCMVIDKPNGCYWTHSFVCVCDF